MKGNSLFYIGAVLSYTLTASDVSAITEARANSSGLHRGNRVAEGETYPMIVTRVWEQPGAENCPDGMVNGAVLLDGTDTLWVISVHLDPEADDNPAIGKCAFVLPPLIQVQTEMAFPEQLTAGSAAVADLDPGGVTHFSPEGAVSEYTPAGDVASPGKAAGSESPPDGAPPAGAGTGAPDSEL